MNRIKRRRTLLLVLSLALCLVCLSGIAQAAAEKAAAEEKNYIYFDLAAGNVEIGPSGYTGYVYVAGTLTTVTGEHKTENNYYIYQSTEANRATTGYVTQDNYTNKICTVPTYNRVQYNGQNWTEYITNNIKVEEVSGAWETAAGAVGRKPSGEQKSSGVTSTGNRIIFTDASGYTANVTIDNIWTYYQDHQKGRTTGGIGANLGYNRGTKIQIWLKGDNRVGNVHYGAREGTGNQIIFANGEADGQTPGSLTVADFPSDFSKNHWCSAIGGDDDSCDPADGIVIDSGVIYAGATWQDNCTAIGGGGNAFGRVTINKGTVTAVTAGTGTAIGGGIGYGEPGGSTEVTITGGTIYAYNLGINPETDKNHGGFAKFVPAAAIGGGGSNNAAGNLNATITITGGTVYAQSVGGPGIGGGGSANSTGGPAKITIEGGTIIAKSTKGSYNGEKFSAGASIGGGTGATGGGSVTLNISGESTILRTGSIGGGKATESGSIGSAQVTISNGDIVGQVIMAGSGKSTDPKDICSFTMSNGKIHSTNVIDGNTVEEQYHDPQPEVKIQYLENNGGALWMQDPLGKTNISGGTIENCTAYLGGAIYMEGGTFTLSDDGKIQNNTARLGDGQTLGNGGGVYVTGGTANINGGAITANKAQNRGGGLYVTSKGEGEAKVDGKVTVKGGSIKGNTAGYGATGNAIADLGYGGGVCLEGGLFTMEGGTISGNQAHHLGGGIYLTQTPDLKSGTISGNKAEEGGGLCVDDAQLILKNDAVQIFGNQATNGGGVAVLDGSFTLNGGAVGVAGQASNHAQKGGGVFVYGGSATVSHGNIWYNSANEGGGVYLTKGEGVFTLDGENAVISHNTAKNGGGVYLYKDPKLNNGKIEANTAAENGGGMHISDCIVNLQPTGHVIVTGNTAKNGAGIYIDRTPAAPNPAVELIAGASPDDKVGLHVLLGTTGTVSFTKNAATEHGGAVCVNAGRFVLESGHITITGNTAKNGGGVAVLNGNFTMTAGAMGQDNGGANTATNGGGVYVSGGEVWLKGGSVEHNTATNGGGAYVIGKMYMLEGALKHNSATENGGGAYVAGNFEMWGGTIGGSGSSNTAKSNGGGVYVLDGNVTVVYGEISHNSAENDGGGFFISAANQKVQVKMLSGSLSFNQAKQKGGGMAVESGENAENITVDIGCLLNHNLLDGKPRYPVFYVGDYDGFASFDNKNYQHGSCPKVQNNQAGDVGGGFYLNSSASTLHFLCVEESGNTAAKDHENSEGMDVEGGTVIIGDEKYHNHNNTAKPHDIPWGYISMDNATLVNGGKVDIYGDMTNPIFKDEVTVDIHNKETDHFIDHRRVYETVEASYKVHYIENFFGTGLYKAYQYDPGHTQITIEGAMYNRPGYQILGWCTQPERDPNGENNYYYEVGKEIDLSDSVKTPGMGIHKIGCEICDPTGNDAQLLELYAIWKANGYTVVFDPNVPAGESYTGTMDDKVYSYGVEKTLPQNAYKYPGHFFTGWNTKADGTGASYEDKKSGEFDLTDQDGATVVLYAQWEPCEHNVPERWSYEVEDGKTLKRICSCGGQTLTATLNAQDTVYDGNPHPAELVLDDPIAWGNDAPTIEYKAEWLDDGLTHTDPSPALTNDGKPFHAGIYTASIKKGTGDKEKTASVQYTIKKANQPAPADKPTYTVAGNTVTVNKITRDSQILTDPAESYTARAEYRLSHYENGELIGTVWAPITDGTGKLDITMNTAWASYYVEVRYEELNDYNPSDAVRANTVYHYAGNVTVIVDCDPGIEAVFDAKLNPANNTLNGADLVLTTRGGYYLVGDKYVVTATLEEGTNTSSPTTSQITPTNLEKNKFNFSGVPDNSTLTITIGTAKKKPNGTAQVRPGQKFSQITGTATTISRDSAFTAAFQISNYDPATYAAPTLSFSEKLPADTTVIMVDRSNGSYWYYRATGEINALLLTAFQKMGGSGSYTVPTAGANGYVDLSYQFIVDFSQSTGGYSADSLKMTLEAAVKNSTSTAPEIKPEVTVKMANSSFEFTLTPGGGLTNSFTCKFTKGADASKWENRASALVLKPSGATLPPDARIQAKVGDRMTYLYKSGDSFIIPLPLLQAESQVTLTLLSDLFPATETTYSFTAQWQISPSKAGKAPVNGYLAGAQANVTFTSPVRSAPSLKVTSDQGRVLSGGTLELTIATRNLAPADYTISATLRRKAEDGTYVGTGWYQESVTGDHLTAPLAGQTPGSFCLMLTVKAGDDITTVMEVPYYFIIKQTP